MIRVYTTVVAAVLLWAAAIARLVGHADLVAWEIALLGLAVSATLYAGIFYDDERARRQRVRERWRELETESSTIRALRRIQSR